MMGRLQVICTMDQTKEAKQNVQRYMRKHKSDEDFIKNISDDFVMGFMISQRMAWDDYDNGTQMKRKDAEKQTMERLTHKRKSGMKTGYWSPNKKQELVDRLAMYEDREENDDFGKWILCSERLPENAMNVIAQFSSGTVTELRYAGNGIFEGIYEYSTKVIIAWMPLPTPYEKGE